MSSAVRPHAPRLNAVMRSEERDAARAVLRPRLRPALTQCTALMLVAGVVLLALGLKKTLEHVDDPLKLVPSVALLAGTAIYLLAHVAFRWRNVHRFNWARLAGAIVLLLLIPVAVGIPALATVAILAAVLAALIAYERVQFAELRDRLRHQLSGEAG